MSAKRNNLPPSVEREDMFQTKLRLVLFGLHVQNVQVEGHPQTQFHERHRLSLSKTRRVRYIIPSLLH